MEERHLARNGALEDFLQVVKRYKWIILTTTLVVPAVAFFLSTTREKVFEATSEVLLQQQDLGAALTGIPSVGSDVDPERFARTQAALASVEGVAARAIELAKVTGISPASLLRNSDVSPRVDADLLRFTVTDTDPGDARRLATAYAVAFTEYKLKQDTRNLARARKELETRLESLRRQGSSGTQLYADLYEKANNLRTLELLQERASVARPATDAEQIEPRPKRNAILGAALGLILGLGIAFVANALDRRIRSEDEVEFALEVPQLARLQRYKERGRSGQLVMLREPTHVAAESVRRLRTNLELAAMTANARTIMVTSAAPREGKSTTIANLAVALGRAGHSVILVDLDLRKPMIASLFGLNPKMGVTEAVTRRIPVDQILVPVNLTGSAGGRAGQRPNLYILGSGLVPPDPGEFVTSPDLAALLQNLRERADFVLIDAPPMLAVGDAASLATAVDAMFIVVRKDMVDRQMLRDLARAVERTPAATLGYVLTAVDSREAYGGEAYGYGPSGRSAAPSELADPGAPLPRRTIGQASRAERR